MLVIAALIVFIITCLFCAGVGYAMEGEERRERIERWESFAAAKEMESDMRAMGAYLHYRMNRLSQ